jgi:futalosine hydrolase
MSAAVLVVSAHGPELSGLRTTLGEASSGGERKVVAQAVGIGLVAAAVGAASAIRRAGPRAVVFVGTCGAYPGRGLSLGDVVVGRRLFLTSTAVLEGRGAYPAPMRTAADANAPLADALANEGAREVTVGTTLAITTDDGLAERIARDADVEHLEAFAVAEACSAAGVAFAVVLGVANFVGANAREQWRANHRAAGDAAGALVARWLERGSAGFKS